MSPSLIEFLQHIENELIFIETYTSSIEYDEFMNNELLPKATVRSFEIIGEACKKSPMKFDINTLCLIGGGFQV